MTQEDEKCLVDAQSENADSRVGWNPEITPEFLPSSASCLLPALNRLATALEEQNQALWSLIRQTAALIEIVAEGRIADDEDANPKTYLDGTRIS